MPLHPFCLSACAYVWEVTHDPSWALQANHPIDHGLFQYFCAEAETRNWKDMRNTVLNESIHDIDGYFASRPVFFTEG